MRMGKSAFIIPGILLCHMALAAMPDTLWTRIMGDSLCYFTSADKTDDGGFILTGPHGGIWVVKVDTNGDSVWVRVLTEAVNGWSNDHSRVITAPDGGYLVTTGGDPWLVKFTSSGDIAYEKAFSDLGLPQTDRYMLTDAVNLSDGSTLFAGMWEGIDTEILPLFVRMASDGTMTWLKLIGQGRIMSIVEVSDGILVGAGNLDDPATGISGPGTLTLNSDGDSLRMVIYRDNIALNDTTGKWREMQRIELTSTGNYILAGRETDTLQNMNYYVIHADSDGNLLWDNTYCGVTTGEAYFASEFDEGFFVGGTGVDTTSGIASPYTYYLDNAGNVLWETDLGLSENKIAWDLVKIDDGEYLYAGIMIISYEPFRLTGFMARVTFNGPVGISAAEVPNLYELKQNYPNPFNPVTTLKYAVPEQCDVRIIIYDVLGRTVREWTRPDQKAGWYEIIWDGRDSFSQTVSSGIYFYRLQAGDLLQTRKMLLLK